MTHELRMYSTHDGLVIPVYVVGCSCGWEGLTSSLAQWVLDQWIDHYERSE